MTLVSETAGTSGASRRATKIGIKSTLSITPLMVAMLSSGARILVFLPLAVFLKYQPGFTINQVWYVSILSVTVQAVVSFMLVRREFRLRLAPRAA